MAMIPLHPCSCGLVGIRTTLEYRGEVIGAAYVCDQCRAKMLATLTRVRPVFDAMITAGVDRIIANEAMKFLLSKL